MAPKSQAGPTTPDGERGGASITEQAAQRIRPRTLAILDILAEAGENGVFASDIARHFKEPETQQRRNSAVNQFLHTLSHKGRVRRSDEIMPTTGYHNVPAFRWYITPAGMAYLQIGGREGIESLRREALRDAQRTSQERLAERERALVNYLDITGPPVHGCQTWRYWAVRRLRSRLITLSEIGAIMGISRERVRQIESGPAPVCKCPSC